MVLGAVALFFCALKEARVMSPQADGDSMVLQAWAMMHGNLLLHGWWVSDVSFYSTELPEYMLVDLFRGMRPDVVTICAALTYTLLVVLAAIVAHGGRRGRVGLTSAGITVAIMLGPSILAATYILNDPDHAGTAVPLLVAIVLIDRGGRRRWVPVAAAVVLTLAMVGDPLVLVAGIVPLAAVAGFRALRLLVRRRVPLREAWYELALVAAAVVAALAGFAIPRLIRAAGGYMVNGNPTKLQSLHTILANIGGTAKDFIGLYSVDFAVHLSTSGVILAFIHLIGAILVAAAVIMALWKFFRGGDLVAGLLATAMLADMAAYTLIYQVTGSTIREIAPVFSLGAALAGREWGEPLLRYRLYPLLVAGAAVSLYALFPPMLSAKTVSPDGSDLAVWLEQHNLHQGLSGYWQANNVTVDSGGGVTMRAVREFHSGLAPYHWELDTALFDPRVYYVNFLVATAPGSEAGSTVTEQEATARFGQPDQTYTYHRYTIMVWQKNLLTELPPP